MKAEDEMGPTGYVTERHTRCVVARDFFARDETSSASKKKNNSFGRDPSPPPTAATPADPYGHPKRHPKHDILPYAPLLPYDAKSAATFLNDPSDARSRASHASVSRRRACDVSSSPARHPRFRAAASAARRRSSRATSRAHVSAAAAAATHAGFASAAYDF